MRTWFTHLQIPFDGIINLDMEELEVTEDGETFLDAVWVAYWNLPEEEWL